MTGPLISVITCTYNRADFIDLCIQSVETQTYHNIEHIFIDAFSTDGTVEKIREYMLRNPHKKIKLYQYPPKGIANAMNMGVKHSHGDILNFLHTDDYYNDENALKRVAQYFEEIDTEWISGNALFSINKSIYKLPLAPVLKHASNLASFANIISHENTFVSRKFVEKYGPFEETHKVSVEYPLWLRALKEISPTVVEDAFTVFIIHNGSASANPTNYLKGVIETVKSWDIAKNYPIIGDPDKQPILVNLKKVIDKINSLELD